MMWTADAAFPGWRKNIVLVWLSQLLVMSGFDATIPFIALLLRDQYGVISEGERGIYMSMFYFFGMLGYVVSCPVWGALGDRFGIKIMLLRGTFLTAFIFPLMGYASEVWILITLRFITAACAGTTSASQMLLAKTVPDNRQGFALGLLSTAVWSGSMLGNVIGGYTVHYFGYQTAFFLCGIMYFMAGIFVLFLQDAVKNNIPHDISVHKEKVPWLKRIHLPAFTVSVWLMLLIFLLMGFMRRFEIPYLAMRIEQITGPDDADKWTGLISAYVAAGGVCAVRVAGNADGWRNKSVL